MAGSFRKIPIPTGWATRSVTGTETRSSSKVMASMTAPGLVATAFPTRNNCASPNEFAVPTSGTWRSALTYVKPGAALLAPWNFVAKYLFDDTQPLEYVCNENERDRAHLVGKASDLQSLKLEPRLLAEYAGTYEYKNPERPEASRVLIFTVADGQLHLSMGRSSYLLTTLSMTMFATTNGDQLEFFRNEDGTVSHVFAQLLDGDIKAVRRK